MTDVDVQLKLKVQFSISLFENDCTLIILAFWQNFIAEDEPQDLRLRWHNQLDPKVNRGPFQPHEDEQILKVCPGSALGRGGSS